MYDLAQKIEEYTEELYHDLGLAHFSDEQKADMFARVQEHFHEIILGMLEGTPASREAGRIRQAFDQENYGVLDKILKRYPEVETKIEDKIERGLGQLKLTIAEEQKNVRTNNPASS